MALLPMEAQQISDLLVTTFKGRFRKITDGAQNAQIEETDLVREENLSRSCLHFQMIPNYIITL